MSTDKPIEPKPINVAEELATVHRALAAFEHMWRDLDKSVRPPPGYPLDLSQVQHDMLGQLGDAITRLTAVVEKHEADAAERARTFEAFLERAKFQLGAVLSRSIGRRR